VTEERPLEIFSEHIHKFLSFGIASIEIVGKSVIHLISLQGK